MKKSSDVERQNYNSVHVTTLADTWPLIWSHGAIKYNLVQNSIISILKDKTMNIEYNEG